MNTIDDRLNGRFLERVGEYTQGIWSEMKPPIKIGNLINYIPGLRPNRLAKLIEQERQYCPMLNDEGDPIKLEAKCYLGLDENNSLRREFEKNLNLWLYGVVCFFAIAGFAVYAGITKGKIDDFLSWPITTGLSVGGVAYFIKSNIYEDILEKAKKEKLLEEQQK